jgi:hypothetical protein
MKGFIDIKTTRGEIFKLNINQVVKFQPHPSTENGHRTTIYTSDGNVIEANSPIQYLEEIIEIENRKTTRI